MSSNRPKLDLPPTGKSVPIALVRAREKVMTPIRGMLSASGITEQQWRVLRVLEEFGAQEATRLADRSSLLASSQTRIVQTLMEKGFVTRTPDDKDRRRQNVELTDSGYQLLKDNLPRSKEIAAHIRQVVGEEDLQTLQRILEKFDNIQADV